MAKARNIATTTSQLTRQTKDHGDIPRSRCKKGMQIAFAQRNQDKKTFKRGMQGNEGSPEFPCTMDKVHALLDTWIRDKEIVLLGVEKLPTQKEKMHASFCRYHRKVQHATNEFCMLCWIFHK